MSTASRLAHERAVGLLAAAVAFALAGAACDGGVIQVQQSAGTSACGSPPPAPQADSAPLFDEGRVVELRLTFSDTDWAALQTIHAMPPADWGSKKTYVHCGVDFDGNHADAACRPRGNTSAWATEPKPQLVVKFDEWDSKGRFLGLRRINLDDTPFPVAPVRQRLGLGFMRAVGLPAARATHARVLRNGQLLGLYTVIEEVDAEFAQHRFAGPSGNLYSSGIAVLENNKKTADTSRRDRLAALMANAPAPPATDAAWMAKVAALLDVDEVLKLAAAESLLPTGDGFSNGSANYYGYDDPCTARFVFLPTDLERSIGTFAPADADPHGAFSGLPELMLAPNTLLAALLADPARRKQYDDELAALRDGEYAKLAARVDTICGQIRDDFTKDGPAAATAPQFDADCADLKKRLADRAAFLKGSLGR